MYSAMRGVTLWNPFRQQSMKRSAIPGLFKKMSRCRDTESMSRYGVLRGLHFQHSPHAQAKLVRVVKGNILDVAVDIRDESPTYGKYYAIELTDDNKKSFFIPRGFAHGFVVLSQEVIFQYKCDNYYAPQSEGSIVWNDPSIAIDWRVPATDIILSKKDRSAPLLIQ